MERRAPVSKTLSSEIVVFGRFGPEPREIPLARVGLSDHDHGHAFTRTKARERGNVRAYVRKRLVGA